MSTSFFAPPPARKLREQRIREAVASAVRAAAAVVAAFGGLSTEHAWGALEQLRRKPAARGPDLLCTTSLAFPAAADGEGAAAVTLGVGAHVVGSRALFFFCSTSRSDEGNAVPGTVGRYAVSVLAIYVARVVRVVTAGQALRALSYRRTLVEDQAVDAALNLLVDAQGGAPAPGALDKGVVNADLVFLAVALGRLYYRGFERTSAVADSKVHVLHGELGVSSERPRNHAAGTVAAGDLTQEPPGVVRSKVERFQIQFDDVASFLVGAHFVAPGHPPSVGLVQRQNEVPTAHGPHALAAIGFDAEVPGLPEVPQLLVDLERGGPVLVAPTSLVFLREHAWRRRSGDEEQQRRNEDSLPSRWVHGGVLDQQHR